MGQDDDNVGVGPEECPGHDFTFERMVLVREPGRMIPGLGIEHVCRWCGTPAYEPSQLER